MIDVVRVLRFASANDNLDLTRIANCSTFENECEAIIYQWWIL